MAAKWVVGQIVMILWHFCQCEEFSKGLMCLSIEWNGLSVNHNVWLRVNHTYIFYTVNVS